MSAFTPDTPSLNETDDCQRRIDSAILSAQQLSQGAQRISLELQAATQAQSELKKISAHQKAALEAQLQHTHRHADQTEAKLRDADQRLRKYAAEAKAQYQALRETAEKKLAEAATQSRKDQTELREARQREAQLAARLKQFEDLARKNARDLENYKNSWTLVMERERLAQTHVAERTEMLARLRESETQLQIRDARAEALTLELAARDRLLADASRSALLAETANAKLETTIRGLQEQTAQIQREVRAVENSAELEEAFESLQRFEAERQELERECATLRNRLNELERATARAGSSPEAPLEATSVSESGGASVTSASVAPPID